MELKKKQENKVGISLVQALREFLIANNNMSLAQAQEIAENFDTFINWVDWIELKNGTVVFDRGWELNNSR
jgi:hypothetical protein